MQFSEFYLPQIYFYCHKSHRCLIIAVCPSRLSLLDNSSLSWTQMVKKELTRRATRQSPYLRVFWKNRYFSLFERHTYRNREKERQGKRSSIHWLEMAAMAPYDSIPTCVVNIEPFHFPIQSWFSVSRGSTLSRTLYFPPQRPPPQPTCSASSSFPDACWLNQAPLPTYHPPPTASLGFLTPRCTYPKDIVLQQTTETQIGQWFQKTTCQQHLLSFLQPKKSLVGESRSCYWKQQSLRWLRLELYQH